MLNSLKFTDYLMLGGITMIAYILLRKKNSKNEKLINLKTLKAVPLSTTTTTSIDSTNQSKSLTEKMKSSGKNMVVFFGSQTGTAEEFAQRLVKNSRLYGIKAIVADPEELEMDEIVKLNEIRNVVAVFIVATYGEGDPTDNAVEMHEYLQQNQLDLAGLTYAVFGLGNKTYEHYNVMGKYFDKRLEELNGKRLIPLGLGDDDCNIEEDFVTWMNSFWPLVCNHLGISATEQDISIRQYKLLSGQDVAIDKVFKGEIARLKSYEKQRPPFDAKNPYLAPVIANRNLFKGDDRRCLHIELDIKDSRLRYEAGDHVAIFPSNSSEIVDKIGELLCIDLDTVFSLVNIDTDASKKNPFPCPTTYRVALTSYLDITSILSTQVIKEFAQYAVDEDDKTKLQLMGSPTDEGKSLYNSFIRDQHVDLLTLLELMPSLKPPIDHVLELLPRLQAKYYSISSSSKLYPNSIHITCVVVEYKTKLGRLRKGVATTWLETKIPTEEYKPRIPVFIRKSQFRLPFKFSTPVLMIGPGTGLAPFRGFIQERDFHREEGRKVGKNFLYYGCRNKDIDYLYKDELEEFGKKESLTLNVAFSRDQEEKIYVTHLLEKHGEIVWEHIKDNGHIYVCGDARNMAREVHEIIVNICKKYGNMASNDAHNYVKDLAQKSRYVQDVWS
jgi:NADPH-ferrihemoprotein reductase